VGVVVLLPVCSKNLLPVPPIPVENKSRHLFCGGAKLENYKIVVLRRFIKRRYFEQKMPNEKMPKN
jgi:hypothetical protein